MTQSLLPTLNKLLRIDRLIALGATGFIPTRSRAFEMHHGSGGLIDHLHTPSAHAETQISILVIGRAVVSVKAVERGKQFTRQHQTSAGHIIGFADEVVLRAIRLIIATEIPAAAIAENNATGFLKRTVRIHKPRADHTRISILLKATKHGVKPMIGNLGIVIQKHQIFTARGCRTTITAGNKTKILRICRYLNTSTALEPATRVVAGSIVNHYDFKFNIDGHINQTVQTVCCEM